MKLLAFVSPSADVHRVAPIASREAPALGPTAAAPSLAARGGLATGLSRGWLLGGFAAVAATAACARRRRRAVLRAAVKDSPAPDPQFESGVCGSCGDSLGLKRRGMLGAGLVAAVPAAPASALFEGAPFDRQGAEDAPRAQVSPDMVPPLKGPKCPVCVGKGIMRCTMCEGTGNYRNTGMALNLPRDVTFVTCPECGGVGSRICDLCIGTGLPTTELRGVLRKPEFAAVIKRLKIQGLQLDKLKEYQADVRAAVLAGRKAA